jgi:glyoxylase I family protein
MVALCRLLVADGLPVTVTVSSAMTYQTERWRWIAADGGSMPHRTHETRSVLMKMQYHHMNLCTENVPRLSEFYRSVFGLGSVNYQRVNASDATGFGGAVDFVTDGAVEFHIARRDIDLGFRMKHIINPLDRGHFCFRTDDIESFKRRLEEKKIPYSDYGTWAMAGWYQIFFHDPDGNIIEVHQTGK